MHIVLLRGVGENEDKDTLSTLTIQEPSARHQYGMYV